MKHVLAISIKQYNFEGVLLVLSTNEIQSNVKMSRNPRYELLQQRQTKTSTTKFKLSQNL